MLAETVPPDCGPGTIRTTGVVERVADVRVAVTPEDEGANVRVPTADATGFNAGRAKLTNAREVTPEVCAAAGCSLATVPEGGGPSEVVPSMLPGPGGSEQAATPGGRAGSVLTRLPVAVGIKTVVVAGLRLSCLITCA